MDIQTKIAGNVKMEGSNKVGGYGVQFGSPDRKDLSGEYFSASTDFMFDLFTPEMRRPTLYDHGQNDIIGDEIIGTSYVKDIDSRGIFFVTELDKARRYIDEIKKLIAAGVLKYSSGTAGQLRSVRRDDGWISRWAIIETSLTPRPCEWRLPALDFVRSWYQEQDNEMYAAVKSVLGKDFDRNIVVEFLRQADLESPKCDSEVIKKYLLENS